MNNKDKMNPNGKFDVVASSAAGKLLSWNALAILPGFRNSKAMPEPPRIVNQKFVTKGATMANMIMIDRIDRPLEILAMNMAIIGP